MSSEKKSKRKQAFDIFKEHEGNIDLVEIARLLDSPPGTVRGWKSKDKWDNQLNGTFQEEKRSVPKEKTERSKARGAPKGNQNAIGNDGGAPKGNKNAIKTGEYETIYSEYLTDEEKSLFGQQIDSSFVLSQEIHLLRIRQVRMLKRLKDAENGLNENEKTILYELRGRKTMIEAKGKKVPVDIDKELMKTEVQESTTRKIDDVLRIEDALTRVSSQLARAVKQYDESLLFGDKKLMLEQQVQKLKAEVEVLRGSKEGNEDATDWKAALAEAEKELNEMSES